MEVQENVKQAQSIRVDRVSEQTLDKTVKETPDKDKIDVKLGTWVEVPGDKSIDNRGAGKKTLDLRI